MRATRFCVLISFAASAPAQYVIQTLAGSNYSGDGGLAVSALLIQPEGVVLDANGNLYVADANDHRVRMVTADGNISTIAGTGIAGFSGDGGPAISAQLNQPYGLAIDGSGNLYIADLGNARVRVVTPGGLIQTFAGGGAGGTASPADALLNSPRNVSVGARGTVYFSDFGGHRVYSVQGGILSVVAGTGVAGNAGDSGPAAQAQLNYPAGIVADSSGNLFIADSGNDSVRVVSGGTITTLISTPAPVAVSLDRYGTLYVAGASYLRAPALGITNQMILNDFLIDGAGNVLYSTGHLVEKITPLGDLTVLAGSGLALFFGDGGPATSARLNAPTGVASNAAGDVFFADTGNNRIRRVNKSGTIDTVLGTGDPSIMSSPGGIAFDPAGNLYVADTGNNRVLAMAPDGALSIVLTQVKNPWSVATDPSGNLYVADRGNARVLAISPLGALSLAASVGDPIALAVDSAGVLYVSDYSQDALLKITPDGHSAVLWKGLGAPGGVVLDKHGNIFLSDTAGNRIDVVSAPGMATAAAGTGVAGFAGDGQAADKALLAGPTGITLDANGNVLVADTGNGRIRKLTPAVVPPPVDTLSPVTVVNAASNRGSTVAPGEIVSIYGQGFDPATSQVIFDKTMARIFYASPTQINALAPDGLMPGSMTVVTVNSGGTPVGGASLPVAGAAPGIFATPEDQVVTSTPQPAVPGSIVVLYATGQGEQASFATLTIGGTPAELLYAGAAPGFAGLMQINARIPDNLPPGPQPVLLTVGTQPSQPGVALMIQ